MGNLLDVPKTEKLHVEVVVTSSGLNAGAAGMQGWRLEMEDSHIISDIASLSNHTLVAIFDGHGGAGAAKYASANLLNVLQNTTDWGTYISTGQTDLQLLGNAMSVAFEDMDNLLKKQQEQSSNDTSGCTAVSAIISPKYILCANAGDSRCVLGTNSETKNMSEDHKPTDEPERKRIENAGGSVQWKRVDGDLAVSRALGDFQYKQRPDLSAKYQKVSCCPDITIHERTPQDDVLILACDGVWDVMTSAEAVGIVREIFSSGETNMQLVAEELIDVALNKGSRDNISAVVVQLPGAVMGPSSNGGVLKKRAERERAAALADVKKREEYAQGKK